MSPKRIPARRYTEADTRREEDRAADIAARVAGSTAVNGDKLKAELDELLDEIDEVLEDNAEEFVRSYVQKGGQ